METEIKEWSVCVLENGINKWGIGRSHISSERPEGSLFSITSAPLLNDKEKLKKFRDRMVFALKEIESKIGGSNMTKEFLILGEEDHLFSLEKSLLENESYFKEMQQKIKDGWAGHRELEGIQASIDVTKQLIEIYKAQTTS